MHIFRDTLRAATADAHSRLDGLISTLNFSRRDDYAIFLTIHSAALPRLERRVAELCAGLPELDLASRLRTPSLLRDLAALGRPAAAADPAPHLDGREEALGALYVLEGSRLGANLLRDRVAASGDGAVRAATAYLDHGKGLRLWPSFLECADRQLQTGPAIARAATGAERAFGAFIDVCERLLPSAELETSVHV